MIPLASAAISVIHFIMAFRGFLNPTGVMISVVLASVISLIICFTFESSIKNQDFTMIAGHRKTDEADLRRYARQLRTISRMAGGLALLMNVLYSLAYFSENKRSMTISIVFFAVYLTGLASIILMVNYKYNRRT